MVRLYFLTLCFLIASPGFAQTSYLQDAVAKLERALVVKDTVTLKQLLHNDLTYGHSNGWTENKKELIQNLVSNKLTYKKIKSKDLKWTISDRFVSLRSSSDIDYVLDGKPGSLRLHVLQVWTHGSQNRWQLIARQSTRLEPVH